MPLTTLLTLAASLCPTRAPAQNPPPAPLPQAEEYRVRDAVESSFVNLATFPVRPMALDAKANLWALNQHDSSIVRFTKLTTPSTTFPLPWAPAAVAFWSGINKTSQTDDEMLITCRGSWTVVEMLVSTGEILHVHQLRPQGTTDSSVQGQMAEPGDILVIGNQAFVTCSGADAVLQLDLVSKSTFFYDQDAGFPAFMAKHPLFLSKDEAGMVYVAPLISGNNTAPTAPSAVQLQTGANDVIQLPLTSAGQPDDDLFRIDPATHTLTLVAQHMGTVLFAHGINPATGLLWMLNTDARNAEFNSEPEANGKFSEDRVSILDLSQPLPLTAPTSALYLDPGMPSGHTSLPNLVEPVGQPFSLTFLDAPDSPEDGHAFVCGLLTDNVVELDKLGNHVRQWTVQGSPRAIPRQVLLSRDGTKLLVYCWGDNSVRVYDWHNPQTAPSVLALGFDPTPAAIRDGRALFFNAQHSRYENLSCATCHVEGGSDLLSWNLSNVPQDDKGPMVTQTLVGIERMAPFHWRGERSLADFRGAFKGLLGKVDSAGVPEDLDQASFDLLQGYLFSLTNPANPNQSRRRVLDDNLTTPGTNGLATLGQGVFNDTPSFAGDKATCANCHSMPLGTLGDIIDESPGISLPRRTQMKPPPFHELWRKEMAEDSFDVGFGSTLGAFLGAGFTHVGIFKDLATFIGVIAPGEPDIAAFVHQWDQGLGQAAHFAFLLNSSSAASSTAQLSTYLLDQAKGRVGDVPLDVWRRNCDIVVFGTVKDAGGNASQRRWFFDRYANAGQGLFRCEDPLFTTTGQAAGERDLLAFQNGVGNGESNVFLGLPVGMGERFGVDYDMDGVFNAVDAAPYTPTTVVGAAVAFQSSTAELSKELWTNSKSARLRFDTNLPTKYEVKYWPQSGTPPATPQVTSEVFSRNHSVLVGGLRPSTNHPGPNATTPEYPQSLITYNVEIRAIARDGSSATTMRTLNPLGFEEFSVFNTANQRQRRLLLNHVISSMTLRTPVSGPDRRVTINTAFKRGGTFSGNTFVRVPAPNRVVIGRVFKQDTQTLAVTPLDDTQVAGVAGNSFLAKEAYLSPTAGQLIKKLVVGAPTGILVVAQNPTAADGRTTIDFDLLQPVGANERVIFSVEAVVEVRPGDWHGAADLTPTQQIPLPTTNPDAQGNDPDAWVQWSFPDTKEAGAMVRDP